MVKTDLKDVKCKIRRNALVQKEKLAKRKLKKQQRSQEGPKSKQEPETIETKRVITEDLLLGENKGVDEEEAHDEFAPFFFLEKEAKILLTTSEKPTRESFFVLQEIKNFLPNSFYYPRQHFGLGDISKEAVKREFTHLLLITERFKKPYSLSFSVLTTGPTLCFRIRKYVPSEQIANKGRPTGCEPEIIVKNFHTALGRRVGRAFASLFNLSPDFRGRTVATVYNFRDFVFFRHHRYIFKKDAEGGPEVRAALQEIGPRIILQLRKVHSGCFEEAGAQFEYFYRGRFYVKRNKFFL